MHKALKALPILFAHAGTGKEKIFACMRMTEQLAVELWCVDTNDVTYRSILDTKQLTAVRDDVDPQLSWERFFGAIEEGFVQRKVQIVQDASTMTLAVELQIASSTSQSRKCRFLLQKQAHEAGGSLAMLDLLQNFYWMREDAEYRREQVAAALGDVSADLPGGAAAELKAAHPAKAAEYLLDAEQKARAKLDALGGDKAGARAPPRSPEEGMGLVFADGPFPVCVGRMGLVDARGKVLTSFDYDTKFLGLVKATAMSIADEEKEKESGKKVSTSGEEPRYNADTRYNRVVKALQPPELAAAMKVLSDPAQKIVLQTLRNLDQWHFNVFEMQNLTGGHSLFVTSYALFIKYGVMQRFNLDERIVLNFLSQAEAGYHPNPYHNSTHAADVLHITHYIVSSGGLSKSCRLTPEDEFAALLAALVHDYDHPGINNNFHSKTQSYLARLYNDRSILENHHVGEIFEIMKDPRFDLFAGMQADLRKDMRDTVVEMVLATDMGLHAKILATFKRRCAEEKDAAEKTGSVPFTRKDDQRLILSMAIKMADISNCGRPTHLYLIWAMKIAEEFFLQGDRERNLGLPVSPFMDRTKPAMASGQISFMNYIVIPLFEMISDMLPQMHFTVDLVEKNKAYWQTHNDSS